jgi:multidrug resistance efflux pump
MTQQQRFNVFLLVLSLATLAVIPATAWWWHQSDRQAESLEQPPAAP